LFVMAAEFGVISGRFVTAGSSDHVVAAASVLSDLRCRRVEYSLAVDAKWVSRIAPWCRTSVGAHSAH
jgi:hypothetical protein